MDKLPQTPRTKKVIEYALEESKNLYHNYVGSEHLLLGLLREQEGVAAQVLMNLGVQLEDVREEILNLLERGPSDRDGIQTSPSGATSVIETLSEPTGKSPDDICTVTIDTVARPTDNVVTGLPSFERCQCESVLQGNDVQIVRGTGVVLMPHREEYRGLFDNIISPALEENGIHAMLAEDIWKPGSILNRVWDAIRSSEVIVADVSELDRNVIYELGLCFGVRRFPIILLRDPEELPFGLRMLRFVQYENTASGGGALRKELSDTIKAFLAASRGALSSD